MPQGARRLDGYSPERFSTEKFARVLRRNPTQAERALWGYLRRGPFRLSFLQQQPIGVYIADFYCDSLQLVIEADGAYHQKPRQQAKDTSRDAYMNSKGIVVLRFSDEEILSKIEWLDSQLAVFVERRRRSRRIDGTFPPYRPQAKSRQVQPLIETGLDLHVFHSSYDGTDFPILNNRECFGSVYATEDCAQRTALFIQQKTDDQVIQEAFQCSKNHWHLRRIGE